MDINFLNKIKDNLGNRFIDFFKEDYILIHLKMK